jgi:hypothetical protein
MSVSPRSTKRALRDCAPEQATIAVSDNKRQNVNLFIGSRMRELGKKNKTPTT